MQRFFRDVSNNWKSGLTVALVSVPLSLSLSIASGATPIMGIITAIWAGLVAAMFAGSNYNVVGPAGALSGILLAFSMQHGVAMLPILAIATGIAIFACYLLKWDKYLVFIPSSVIHGFTLGVGVTIAAGQLNFALGLSDMPKRETLVMNAYESFSHIGQADPHAFGLFAATLFVLFAIVRWLPRVPPVIAAAAVGIVLGYLSEIHVLPFAIQTVFSKYGAFSGWPIDPPAFAFPAIDTSFIKAVFTVSVVAVLETLLSAKIADVMTKTRFDQTKEVLALALANVASGLAGGLPATGVLARTALNIKTGASSKMSSGINAVFVLLIAVAFFGVFQYLPLAVVGAILWFAAIRMVDATHFAKLLRFDPFSFGIAVTVAVLTVAIDPMVGILAGATISLLVFVRQISRNQGELTIHKDNKMVARIPSGQLDVYPEQGDVVVYRIAGEMTYFNAKSHEDAIKKIRAGTIVLSLRNLFYIDLDGLEMLHEVVEGQRAAGRTVYVSSVSEYMRPLLEREKWFAALEGQGMVFRNTTGALASLGFPLGGQAVS